MINYNHTKKFFSVLLEYIVPLLSEEIKNFAEVTLVRWVTTDCTFHSTEPQYKWILHWIESTQYSKTTRHMQISHIGDIKDYNHVPNERDKLRRKTNFLPDSNYTHPIQYKNTTLRVTLTRSLDRNKASKIHVRIYSFASATKIIQDFISDAEKLYKSSKVNTVLIYTSDVVCGTWSPTCEKAKRDLSTVILNESLLESLVADLSNFLSEKTKFEYGRTGDNYRRSYLLYGPPGTGKSSTVFALASHFNLSICELRIHDKELTDSNLAFLFQTLPENCILLIEDIGQTFTGDNEGISESGLLNCIDGVKSKSNRIMFVTSNCSHEELKGAFFRPGRIDVKKYVGYATLHQLKKFYRLFYPQSPPEDVNTFATRVLEYSKQESVSPALIKDFLKNHRNRPQSALQNIHMMFEQENTICTPFPTSLESFSTPSSPQYLTYETSLPTEQTPTSSSREDLEEDDVSTPPP